MFEKLFLVFEIILFFYLAFNVGYVFLFSISGLFYKATDFNKLKVTKQNKFAILIPAYKHDEVILNTVGHCLNQNYPTDKFDVVVIADSLSQLTIGELLVMPIKLIPVQFEESTKAKSLNMAMAIIPDLDYDYCLVLDVDNIMEKDFLKKINARLQNDEMIIQSHRTAKNLDTPFSVLDGLSEEINNHIFRKGHVSINVTSALSGSGQAMKYKEFKEIMSKITSPVEDKELEFALVKNGIKVLFENDAYVYDEKVQNAKVFSSQRRRWVASQFFDFNAIFIEGIANLVLRGNIDYFDKALQRIILPRVLLLGLSFFSAFLFFVPFCTMDIWFLGQFFACALAYLIAIPSSFFNLRTLNAALRLPQAFYLMVMAMAKSKGATKKFIHTEHSSTVQQR
ncbi:MAG: glycosyltransferase family 2 protein [Bacteroidia bacterium]|nr:glycosyltransferase family 2 protein [Bacteroidia bacterium]MCF8425933.1 glycosyltransferase family 2 protein [Bacteroidia bacterium]MCF8446304.1 glycosyltransferase family 2 protein [Bacteroidia bacterium]